MKDSTIGLKNVSFGYLQKPIIEDLSFSIKLGQFVAITGENGAAKTTSMKLLLGLLKPWKGLRQWSNGLKSSYVPQQISTIEQDFPSTVYEFILSGSWDAKKWFKRVTKDDHKRARDLIEQFELQHIQNQSIGKLSGGQKQKACVARAFMTKPDVLMLDEPTVGMDEDTRCFFYQILKSMCPQVTIVLITHHIKESKPYVDQIIHLERRKNVCLN